MPYYSKPAAALAAKASRQARKVERKRAESKQNASKRHA
jgi:hypothetical protein